MNLKCNYFLRTPAIEKRLLTAVAAIAPFEFNLSMVEELTKITTKYKIKICYTYENDL